MGRRIIHAGIIVAAASAATGCASGKLETGYKYRPLNSTPAQREAYYAGPFSREQLRMRSEDDDADRRPDLTR